MSPEVAQHQRNGIGGMRWVGGSFLLPKPYEGLDTDYRIMLSAPLGRPCCLKPNNTLPQHPSFVLAVG